jgi:hypothetical protein
MQGTIKPKEACLICMHEGWQRSQCIHEGWQRSHIYIHEGWQRSHYMQGTIKPKEARLMLYRCDKKKRKEGSRRSMFGVTIGSGDGNYG